jgi:pimeloyl-ACP methyl ester carboxylesterase
MNGQRTGPLIHWVERGDGPPVVLLHGLGDSHDTWSRVVPALARCRRVLVPDLPGHGFSERPDASYTLEWHSRVLWAWLKRLRLGQIDLVGHSYGGGIAQCMLLEHGSRIRKLVLVSAGGLGRDVSFILRLAGAVPLLVERLGQPFMGPGTRMALRAARGLYPPDEVERLSVMNGSPGSARAFARSVRDVIDWRGQRRCFLDRAHQICALPQVALFWGERDPVIPIAHAIDAAALLGGAALMRFPECGHFPHRERPDDFARALEAFLDAPLPGHA